MDRSQRKRHIPAQRLRDLDMSILEVNIRGLRSNTGELSNLCHQLRASVVVVVETFLDATVKDGADSIDIPGHSLCCRRDRPSKRTGGQSRGGIAVYCLEGVAIFHDCTTDPEDSELSWFSVPLRSQNVLIAVVYRLPSTNCDIISYLDTTTL